MEILGINMSDNAAEQIQKLCDSFQKQVSFHYENDKQNETGGSVDSDDGSKYKVYLPSDLDRRTFEANVLYELFHIRQFEAGYPTLCNKDSILFDQDSELVNGLGSSIFFGVLDLDVFQKMRECRYIDAVYRFVEGIYESLISYASHVYGDLDDKYILAHLVLDLSKVLYHTNPEQDKQVQEAYVEYPSVIEQSFKMRDMMRQYPPDAPRTAAVTMGKIIDMLELWDLFYIKLDDSKIRTKNEFRAFATQ